MIEMKKIPFSTLTELAHDTVETVLPFDSEKGEISYLYAQKPMIMLLFEMGASFPDVLGQDIDLDNFAERYFDGEFDTYIEAMKNNRRIQYYENAVNDAIESSLKYSNGGQLIGKLNKLITAVTSVVEKQKIDFGKISSDDVKDFMTNFGKFATKVNTETLTNEVLKLHQADKPTKAKTSTKKTVKPKTNNSETK